MHFVDVVRNIQQRIVDALHPVDCSDNVRLCRRKLVAGAACFFLGTLIFSGCLAALCLSGVKILGAIVPIGGTLLIAGWILLAIAALRLAR
jgi:uncharacterized membrane protein YgdD (TMEM256/DUF423 family)